MATLTSNPSKGKRKPLKNIDTNAAAAEVPVRSPLPLSAGPDKENRDGLALLLSPAKAKPAAKSKAKKASIAELEELKVMFENLRIEKAKTDELLKERDEMLRLKEVAIESCCREREMLRKEVKKLKLLKEFKPNMSIITAPSPRENDENWIRKKKKIKIKKPCAAYLLFSKDQWNEVRKENPEATFSEISNVISEKWKILDSEAKKPYEERYRKEKEAYLQAVGKERREETAMKLLDEERRQRTAMELLDQYLMFKQEADKEAIKIKKEKDPLKPKRPTSAFFLYSKERREVLLAENKNILEIAKITGEEWKNMSKERRAPYEEIAGRQREEYLLLMEAYKQTKAAEAEKQHKDEEEQMKIMKQEALQLLKKKEKTEDIVKKTKDQRKQRKGEKKKDPNKPKKPASSFLLFRKETRKSLMQERPDLHTSTLNALISVKWKELSDGERQVWIDRATKAMAGYKMEMEEYNKSMEAESVKHQS